MEITSNQLKIELNCHFSSIAFTLCPEFDFMSKDEHIFCVTHRTHIRFIASCSLFLDVHSRIVCFDVLKVFYRTILSKRRMDLYVKIDMRVKNTHNDDAPYIQRGAFVCVQLLFNVQSIWLNSSPNLSTVSNENGKERQTFFWNLVKW